MEIIYSQEAIPTRIKKSIFLAGPTPREKNVTSWRKEALQYLDIIQFDGTVFVPEFKDGAVSDDQLNYSGQIEWEETCLNMADLILFWIPRDMKTLPGLTTNDEYGHWKTSGKVVLGFPKDAPKMRYQEYYAKKNNIPVFYDLKHCLIHIVDKLDEGAIRNGGETKIPLYIWNHIAFQNWYNDLRTAGNRIDDAKVEYVKRVGKNQEILFFISLWAKVFIASENRHKENEIVFMRNNISSCVLYNIDEENPLNSDIVIVKEFRTPVSNYSGMVWEVPGGSSFKNAETAEQVIINELHEETGIEIDPSRLVFEGSRQLQATTLSHKCFLYSCKINGTEVEEIKTKAGKAFGNIEDTEMTYVEVVKLESILKTDLIDWSNVGFILSVIYKNIPALQSNKNNVLN